MEIEFLAKQKIELQKRFNTLNSLKRPTDQSIPLNDKGKRVKGGKRKVSPCCNRLQLQMLQVAAMKKKQIRYAKLAQVVHMINLRLMQQDQRFISIFRVYLTYFLLLLQMLMKLSA